MRFGLPKDFDEAAYLSLNPDVDAAIKKGAIRSAVQHFLDHGQHEGRHYSKNERDGREIDLSHEVPHDFDEKVYMDLHADVAKAVEAGSLKSAAQHFAAFGKKERRLYNLQSPEAEVAFSEIGKSLFRYPYRSFGDMPEFSFAKPTISDIDFQICDRLISAWHLAAKSDPGGVDGMWQKLISGNTRLANALERKDPEAMTAIMSNMFQEHIVHGLAMGRSTAIVARHVPERFAATWCDALLRLGEAVGVSPIRSPEQGELNAPLEFVDFIPDVERRLGFQLSFPPVGAPYGVAIHGTPFPWHAFNHAYVTWRIGRLGTFNNVAEIGGGYGGLCHLMNTQSRKYTIFDLPYTNIIQAYFLMKSGLSVSLYGEELSQIAVLPWWEINNKDVSFDLVINQDSIPEMPLEAGTSYIKRIKQISPHFYSVNQEAGALNTSTMKQLCVPNLISEEGGYNLVARNIFWLRDGYVEEFYETARH